MYFKYDNFDEVKNELEKMVIDYKTRIVAWESVTIEKKRNGEEMARRLSTYPQERGRHQAQDYSAGKVACNTRGGG